MQIDFNKIDSMTFPMMRTGLVLIRFFQIGW